MFDLSSSWVTGRHCALAARGYSRDAKKGCEQIEYGLLTDLAGRPVAVRVFPGNTADPTAFTAAVTAVKDTFALANMVMVGDRGMITSARIAALRELGGIGWLTALRAPAIAKLAADTGPLQMTLFDTHDFAEITHPDYPGERLICCRNPLLAAERARKRGELLTATEQLLTPIAVAVAAGPLAGADQISLKIGKVINKYKIAKHLHLTITDTTLTVTRNHTRITAEAALDGIYVLRTSVATTDLDAAAVISTYKKLALVERDFRSIKTIDYRLPFSPKRTFGRESVSARGLFVDFGRSRELRGGQLRVVSGDEAVGVHCRAEVRRRRIDDDDGLVVTLLRKHGARHVGEGDLVRSADVDDAVQWRPGCDLRHLGGDVASGDRLDPGVGHVDLRSDGQ